MKKFFLAIIILSAAGLSAGIPSALAEGEQKIAFVDVGRVFDEYQKTKDNDRTLQAAGKKKEGERDALVTQIRQLKDELVLVAADARGKKQADLEAKVKALQEFDQGARQDLGEQRNTIVREIFADIDGAVKVYGEQKGFDLIFNERALLYRSKQHDATQDIIDQLNQTYKK